MSFDNVVSLGDVCIDISYGYTASASVEPIGPKFLRITDIVPYFVNWSNVPYCSIDEKQKKKYQLEIGDIVIARTGATTGYNSIIQEKVDAVFASYLIRFKVDKKKANPFYVSYALKTNEYKGFITGIIGGSAQPGANAKALAQFKFRFPELNEQKRVVDILYTLDDKIEINNRINKTLEEMAQAIFKQWFVDFDFPDENGQPYKSSGGEMEESELGLIPKGWKVESLDNIANFLNGLAMQKYPPDDSEKGLAVLKIRELRQGQLDETSNRCSENIDRSYIVNDGDVIFSWSGSLLVDIWCGGKCGLNQHLFKVTSTNYKKWLYYLWTSYHLEKFIAIAQDKATTMGHIQRKHLKEAKVLLPEKKTLVYMDLVMQPIIDKIITGKLENRTLADIRDSLLPKLMSGEIRVPVEEVPQSV